MKSPFTGGAVSVHQELREMEFRKEVFPVQFQYYLCEDSGERFTNDEMDEVNINQVYNQYREKYGIPFPEEIKEIREKYGLAANKMAEILGLGINVYRNYEAGEVPSVSNGRLIQMAKDPMEFLKLVELSKNEFTPEEVVKINKKVNQSIEHSNNQEDQYETLILGEKRPTIYNGYKIPNMARINNMVLFFSEQCRPYKTKLNKLLFYADFLQFRKTCYSISGLNYQAIQKGPVPKNYDWIFDRTMEKRMVVVHLQDFGEYMGEQFFRADTAVFEQDIFSESEISTLHEVANHFRNVTVNQIVNKSHEEQAWLDNVDSFGAVSYEYAFHLKNL